MAARRNLLESDDDGEELPVPATLKVNQDYAKRLEHNKRREDLHRLQELQKQGLVSDDSEEDEDEDEDGLLPQRTDAKIFNTLARIKKKDPSIYKPDVEFFDEDEESEDEVSEEGNAGKKEKRKPVYLKDVTAGQALESSEDEEQARSFKTYDEEQRELKNEFLKCVEEDADGEDDGLFKVKKKSKQEQKVESSAVVRPLEEYFGKNENMDESDRFLKDYLLNQGWIEKDKGEVPSYTDIVGEISEDEEELEMQDKYESAFNFRFEEGASSQVAGHSRIVENSVRKLVDKRKQQRKRKQERLSEMEAARREELKRLKNVKKKEIMERIAQIQAVAGVDKLSSIAEDLEQDFDPEYHDKKMHETFGDEYYEKEDPDAGFKSDNDEADAGKPDFDAEDEALGLPEGWDGREKDKSGFAAVRRKLKEAASSAGDNSNVSEEDISKQIEKHFEEYYKLDYEDMVGDLPTRFKYTQVKPDMFGLTTAQVLAAEDKELNQYISLKLLAPYRTDVPRPRHAYRQHLTKQERKLKALDQVPALPTKKGPQDHPQQQEQTHKKKRKRKQSEDKQQGIEQPSKKRQQDHPQQQDQQQQTDKKKLKHKQDEEKQPGIKQQQVKQKTEEVKVEQNQEKQQQNQEKTKKSRKRKRGLGMSQTRLISYGKIDLPKNGKRKKKKKSASSA